MYNQQSPQFAQPHQPVQPVPAGVFQGQDGQWYQSQPQPVQQPMTNGVSAPRNTRVVSPPNRQTPVKRDASRSLNRVIQTSDPQPTQQWQQDQFGNYVMYPSNQGNAYPPTQNAPFNQPAQFQTPSFQQTNSPFTSPQPAVIGFGGDSQQSNVGHNPGSHIEVGTNTGSCGGNTQNVNAFQAFDMKTPLSIVPETLDLMQQLGLDPTAAETIKDFNAMNIMSALPVDKFFFMYVNTDYINPNTNGEDHSTDYRRIGWIDGIMPYILLSEKARSDLSLCNPTLADSILLSNKLTRGCPHLEDLTGKYSLRRVKAEEAFDPKFWLKVAVETNTLDQLLAPLKAMNCVEMYYSQDMINEVKSQSKATSPVNKKTPAANQSTDSGNKYWTSTAKEESAVTFTPATGSVQQVNDDEVDADMEAELALMEQEQEEAELRAQKKREETKSTQRFMNLTHVEPPSEVKVIDDQPVSHQMDLVDSDVSEIISGQYYVSAKAGVSDVNFINSLKKAIEDPEALVNVFVKRFDTCSVPFRTFADGVITDRYNAMVAILGEGFEVKSVRGFIAMTKTLTDPFKSMLHASIKSFLQGLNVVEREGKTYVMRITTLRYVKLDESVEACLTELEDSRANVFEYDETESLWAKLGHHGATWLIEFDDVMVTALISTTGKVLLEIYRMGKG